jgi:cytochrome P450
LTRNSSAHWIAVAVVSVLGNISPMSLLHTASDDVQVGGYRISKGAVVIPNLDTVMHDETIFPDYCKFDPIRFLDEEGNFQGLENILTCRRSLTNFIT